MLDESHMRLFIANPGVALNWFAFVNQFTLMIRVGVAVCVIVLPTVFTMLIYGGKDARFFNFYCEKRSLYYSFSSSSSSSSPPSPPSPWGLSNTTPNTKQSSKGRKKEGRKERSAREWWSLMHSDRP